MAYDEKLAQRIIEALSGEAPVDVKKMFGGVCVMVRGQMCCGVIGDELMVRVGPEQYPDALKLPHVRPMDFTGRPMKGLVYVAPAGVKSDGALRKWVERGLAFVKSAPPPAITTRERTLPARKRTTPK